MPRPRAAARPARAPGRAPAGGPARGPDGHRTRARYDARRAYGYPRTVTVDDTPPENAAEDAATPGPEEAEAAPETGGATAEAERPRASFAYRFGRGLFTPLARFVYRPRVEGRENLPLEGPLIIASNHLSFIDSIVIPVTATRPVLFMAKASYFEGTGIKGRLMAWFFTIVGASPVSRGAGQAAMDALEQQRALLEQGAAIALYPEGTRSLDGRLYRGRTGVAFLALQTGAQVVPVGLTGTNEILPVGAKVPRLRPRATVRFGAPLDLQRHGPASSGRARRAATDELMAAIHALSGQELAGTYNEPPAPSPLERLRQALPHERRGTGEPA